MKKGSPVKISQAKCSRNIDNTLILFAWDIQRKLYRGDNE